MKRERERVKVRKRDGYEFCGEGRKIRGKNWKTKRKIESKGDRGRPSFFLRDWFLPPSAAIEVREDN